MQFGGPTKEWLRWVQLRLRKKSEKKKDKLTPEEEEELKRLEVELDFA